MSIRRFFFIALAGLAFRSHLLAQQYQWTNLAGKPGGPGTVDGAGDAARFKFAAGLVLDGAGNLFVSDLGSGSIRKITPSGVVTTFAGVSLDDHQGSISRVDGTGAAARFDYPRGMARDSSGNLYVLDDGTLRKISPAGVVTTLTLDFGNVTGPFGSYFVSSSAIAADANDNLYVVDSYSHTLWKVTPAGVVTTLAGSVGNSGNTDGTGSAARFNGPEGVAVDGSGNVYVADTNNHTIRKITPSGVVTTLAGTAGSVGSTNGTGSNARFERPLSLTVDGGSLYVAEGYYAIRKVTLPDAVVTTVAGGNGSSGYFTGNDGTGSTATFQYPHAMCPDGAGNILVGDGGLIRRVTPAGVVTTVAGSPSNYGWEAGTGTTARFSRPTGLTLDGAGNLWVGSALKITPAGVVTQGPYASTWTEKLCFDANGVGYGTDGWSVLYRFDSSGAVSILAGSYSANGSVDGTGSTAQLSHPRGTVVDPSGSIFVAEWDAIRKITPDGVVTTFAGSAGNSGFVDATGSAARFYGILDLAVDAAGTLYVADANNAAIRKVTPAGVVTTLASGLNAIVRGLAVDASGSVYATAENRHVIWKISPEGTIKTIGGTPGVIGGNDGIASAAQFSSPQGIVVTSGRVYVADTDNNRITVGTVVPTPVLVIEQPAGMALSNGSTVTIAGALSLPGSTTFVLRNEGTVALSGVAVLKDGVNEADFTVNNTPAATVAPGGSTTMSLRFSPSSSGGKAAAIHISSSDPSHSPFHINLSGQVLYTQTDYDASRTVGQNDVINSPSSFGLYSLAQYNANRTVGRNEVINSPNTYGLYTQTQYDANRSTGRSDVIISPNTYGLYSLAQYNANRTAGQNDVVTSPNTYGLYFAAQYSANYTSGQNSVLNSPNTYNLYSLSQVQALNVDTPLLSKQPGTGQFKLTISIKKSSDLTNFTTFPFQSPSTSINANGEIEFLFTVPDSAAFFRVGAH